VAPEAADQLAWNPLVVTEVAAFAVGADGTGGLWVTTIVFPLASTANVPVLVHLVPMDMFAALAELPLAIVHV